MPQMKPYAAEQALIHMDVADLEEIVSKALAEPATVIDWQVTLLGGLDSSPMADGVYRVSGTAVTSTNKSQNWAIVVKILRSPIGMTMPDGKPIPLEMLENPRGFAYWQRELLAAQSDLFDDLSVGLRAPNCLGVTLVSEDICWLWQEYLNEDHTWTWDDYREAAYRLGQWQATTQEQIPSYPWLSQQWLAGWVHGPLTSFMGVIEGINGWQHPLLSTYFAPEELATLRQLWANRQTTLDKLAQLPQTLCHLDAYRANLNWQGDELVLLDWAFVGEGALGEELAAFVGATLLLDHVPLAEAEQLEKVALAAYLAGLQAADWSGDAAIIEEVYRQVMPLRYALASLASILRTAIQPEFAADWERNTGKPLADILAHRAGLVRFYVSRQPHAEELAQR